MKIMTIVGARPQFIKAATVSRVLAENAVTDEIIVHTGQHHDSNMSEVFFTELEIPEPDYNLGISGGSHGDMTGRMLTTIEKVMLDERPDCVLIHGDTNSTLAGGSRFALLQPANAGGNQSCGGRPRRDLVVYADRHGDH
jgi:UDP-N-acetylglucosamine 2-epimerase